MPKSSSTGKKWYLDSERTRNSCAIRICFNFSACPSILPPTAWTSQRYSSNDRCSSPRRLQRLRKTYLDWPMAETSSLLAELVLDGSDRNHRWFRSSGTDIGSGPVGSSGTVTGTGTFRWFRRSLYVVGIEGLSCEKGVTTSHVNQSISIKLATLSKVPSRLIMMPVLIQLFTT
jgi:hypothetical protein